PALASLRRARPRCGDRRAQPPVLEYGAIAAPRARSRPCRSSPPAGAQAAIDARRDGAPRRPAPPRARRAVVAFIAKSIRLSTTGPPHLAAPRLRPHLQLQGRCRRDLRG